jgi:hypothetical protein
LATAIAATILVPPPGVSSAKSLQAAPPISNKGIYNLFLTTSADPLGCRLNPSSTVFVHFYANDPATPFTRWTDFMIEATRIGADALKAHYNHAPRRT